MDGAVTAGSQLALAPAASNVVHVDGTSSWSKVAMAYSYRFVYKETKQSLATYSTRSYSSIVGT